MILATMSTQTRITERDLAALVNRPSSGGLARRVRGAAPVELWVVKVTEDGPLGMRAACALFSAEPSEARQRIADRRRSVVARAALARLAAARMHLDPAALALGHDERGHPILLDRPALHVSIAHSGEFVACALSDRRVGVDVERADRSEADDALAARVCGPAERRQLEQIPAGPRRRALIRLWTRKEALAKALGVGLALPFEQLDVRHDVPLIGGVRAAALRIRDLEGGPVDYAVAVATEGRRCRVRAHLVVEHSAWTLTTRTTRARSPNQPAAVSPGRVGRP
jgi:phosphopantetheinyl transferase